MADVYELHKRIMKYDPKAIDEIETLDQAKEIIKMIVCNEINKRTCDLLDCISINEFIVTDKEGKNKILVDKNGDETFEHDLENAVKSIAAEKKIPREDVLILMNKNTFSDLSLIFITMPYVMGLFYYRVRITENVKDGELKIENQ